MCPFVQEIVFVDLKPENVLVHQSGHIKLSDFGSSRFFSEVSATADDRLEGTAEYLAPEVLRGEAISPASDLWAFACVLYQMLAGRTPIWTEDAKLSKAAAKEAAKAAAQSQLEQASMTPEEKAAHRDAEMAAHNSAQKAHLLQKMVAFESQQEEEHKYPANFDADARDLIEKIMRPDPASRIGVRRRADDATNGVRWNIDYADIKAHPFFTGIAWATLHTLPAPSLAGGGVAPAPDAVWARRKNSIMWAPMPKSYTFAEGGAVMEPIEEDRAKEMQAQPPTVHSTGSSSLRAQLFANKTGSLAAPRFASLKEDENEGDEEMTEGDEENEDDEDDDEDSMTDDTMYGRMAAAPLPVAASSGLPPRPRQSSSRASGPNAMAVVEPLKESPAVTSSSALPPRPALRSSIGLRSNLPPSGAAAPSASSYGALPPKPSTIFSSVPRADATAGPTGLGMGLRKMGGNSTASALLSRMMNKPSTMSPTAELRDTTRQPPAAQ